MNWVGFWSIYFLAMLKFMVSSLPGPGFQMAFYETWLASVFGAATASAIFYFGSELVIRISHRRRATKRAADLAAGKEPFNYYKVTRTKKFIVQMKRRFGFYGITLFAPLLFSVPIGSFVAAKFYGKQSTTFLFVLIGLALNGLLLTAIAYAIY
ncbi:MAG: hypothetical protein EB003_00545 [Flavobacteriia bacterium]|jgi:hypothetical protein|nr:hypothetical protein [Flavobacteriia bacterium]